MRVLIAHRRDTERTTLRRILEQDPDFYIVGEIGHTEELLERIQVTRPDVMLLDWDLPGEIPADVLHWLRHSAYPMKVVAFSKRPCADQASIAAGADAFVSRHQTVEELLNTVRAVTGLSPCFV